MTARGRTTACGMRIVPVLHVVLLGHAARAGIADVVVAQEILDLRRCDAVDEIPAPYFRVMHAARMPRRDRARLARMQRRIGEDLPGAADQPPPLTALLAPLRLAMRKIIRDDRRMLIGLRRRLISRQQIDARLMPPLVKRDLQPARQQSLLHVAPPTAAGANTDEVDRAVADIVIAVAAEVLGWEFPVARDAPFLDAAQYFGAALTAAPGVECQIEIADEIAQIFEQGRGRRIPASPHGAFVQAHLRDLDQSPLRLVELLVIGLAKIRHPDKPAVRAIAPAVIWASEDWRVAFIVAAHLHAAMPARIEEHMNLARPVAAQDDGFLSHTRDEIVAGLWDLALMADKQPHPGEQLFQLLVIDLLVDENFAADLSRRHIDETRAVSLFA